MSVQCPHCGGDFNLEVKLTLPVQQPVAPVAKPAVKPATTLMMPAFRISTAAGKFRKALWLAGYPTLAVHSTIYNDKRSDGEARLKLVPRARRNERIEYCEIDQHLKAMFGSDLKYHSEYGGDYVVQIYRAL